MGTQVNGNDGRTGVRTVVVIGNGMVGHRFCERLHARDSQRRHRIVCFGEERRAAYDRVHLSDLFAGRAVDDLSLTGPTWYEEHGITLYTGERVVRLDRDTNALVTSTGRRVPYDVAVLATGSAPFVPAIGGVDLPG